MSTHNERMEEQIEELNEILAKCYDAEKGYKEAADKVEDPKLKSLFREYAQQRYDFGHQIKNEIRSLGGEVDKGDTLAAKAHRVWMDIRSALSGDDESAVLKEAIRGENNALENYNDAIEDMPTTSSAYRLLVDQRNQVRTALNRLEQLLPAYDEN